VVGRCRRFRRRRTRTVVVAVNNLTRCLLVDARDDTVQYGATDGRTAVGFARRRTHTHTHTLGQLDLAIARSHRVLGLSASAGR